MSKFKHILPIFHHGLKQIGRKNDASISGNSSMRLFFTTGSSLIHSSTDNTTIEVHTREQEVVIALGSNVGDRLKHFNDALSLMRKSGICITRHGCLYERKPAYITDQPNFLNSVVRGLTKLSPHDLLAVLKKIEKDLGQTESGIRFGPLPIDLDILFYGKLKISSDFFGSLAISHAPVLVGPSRKKFLGEICGQDVPMERDPATVAAVTAGILGGADIVRVHNVGYCSDATKLCDALLKKGVILD